jgi:hypothetical protein
MRIISIKLDKLPTLILIAHYSLIAVKSCSSLMLAPMQ